MTKTAVYVGSMALAVLAISCGGSRDESLETAIESATETRERVEQATAMTEVTPENDDATPIATTCADPYVDGVPYPVTPGQPLRLRPTGSAPPVEGIEPLPLTNDDELEDVLRRAIGREAEHFSVVVKRLDDGSGASIDPGRLFYPASLFKVWVMLEAYHQRDAGLLDFGERYVVSSYYEHLRLNDGELTPCSEVSVEEALSAMIRSSDNVAANLLYDRVGYTNVNQTLLQLGLGYSGLLAEGDLQTTASGMATVFEAIGTGQAISAGASEEMVALMEGSVINDRIPALLPPGTPVAHKTGNWDNVTHDVGIVYSPNATYVIAVLTDYGPSDGGAVRIARLSQAVYNYYNPVA